MASEIRRIELVGVAGSGKSSLFEALLSSNLPIENGWRFRHPRAFWAALRSVSRHPLWWLGTVVSRPRLDRTSILSLLAMAIQCEFLTPPTTTDSSVVLYDQGAIFSMAMLQIFGTSSSNRFATKLIDRCMSEWSRELDGIIFVDATDHVLFDRINSRTQDHRIAGKTPDEVYKFLRRYRDVFDDLLSDLCGRSEISVLRLRTDELDLSEVLSRSLKFLDANSKEPS